MEEPKLTTFRTRYGLVHSWWLGGQRHRLDGPAVEYPSGYKAWYIEDQGMSFARWIDDPRITLSEPEKTLLRLRFGG